MPCDKCQDEECGEEYPPSPEPGCAVPHSSIVFEAKDERGTTRRWHIELGSASSLRRAGWDGEKLKSGEGITVVGAPAKDGSPAVSAQHEARIMLTDSNTVIYDRGRPVWLSILRLFRR